MPGDIKSAMDAHIGDADRSGYLLRLVEADLSAAGKLPGSPEAEALAEARDLIAAIGPEEFRKTIKAAAQLREARRKVAHSKSLDAQLAGVVV